MRKSEENIIYNWDINILNEIKSVNFSKEEINKIDNLKQIINSNNHRKYNKFIKQINIFYKLYKLGYSTREISKLTNNYFSGDGIFSILKEAGLVRNRDDAQKIGATKRDYGSIKNKMKNTMNERNTNLLGSTVEDYIRNKLDTILYDVLSQDYEIVIGKNTINILKQYENDIPIIIIKNNVIYKFAIEFDGDYWHINNKNDEIKDKLLYNKGYKLFRINSKATITSDGIFKYQNDLNEKIEDIANKIKEHINLELKSCINNN